MRQLVWRMRMRNAQYVCPDSAWGCFFAAMAESLPGRACNRAPGKQAPGGPHGVEVHLEMELGARPVRPPLVRERGRPLVLLVVITPVRRGMGHGELVVVVLVNTLGATTREWVFWWSDRPHSPCEAWCAVVRVEEA